MERREKGEERREWRVRPQRRGDAENDAETNERRRDKEEWYRGHKDEGKRRMLRCAQRGRGKGGGEPWWASVLGWRGCRERCGCRSDEGGSVTRRYRGRWQGWGQVPHDAGVQLNALHISTRGGGRIMPHWRESADLIGGSTRLVRGEGLLAANGGGGGK